VTLRRDHLAGGAFVAAGLIVYAVSGDLPFGSMAMPGAGMLPKLVIVLLIAFGLLIFWRAADSPPFADLRWDDLPHAVRVAIGTAAAIALYESVGFLVTMAGMLFGLIFVVERKPFLPAAAFSVGVTAIAYLLFNTLLKSPLPRGILGF
jgi:uncharacterized membrane protein